LNLRLGDADVIKVVGGAEVIVVVEVEARPVVALVRVTIEGIRGWVLPLNSQMAALAAERSKDFVNDSNPR